MTPRLAVLLDASVLLAAAASPSGGSSAAIEIIAATEIYSAFVSREVLDEVERNLVRKFPVAVSERFAQLHGVLSPEIVALAEGPSALDLLESVAAKDHHVVDAAVACGATICLTLDRRHLLGDELRAWGVARRLFFVRPAEFLAWHRIRTAGIF